jgi:hypothetical protein
MKKELKKINSSVIKIFNDFMISIIDSADVDELEDYFNKLALRNMILDLITMQRSKISFSADKDKNGHYRMGILAQKIHENIKWIKRNLDVWDIKELPYQDNERTFEFTRIDNNEKQ